MSKTPRKTTTTDTNRSQSSELIILKSWQAGKEQRVRIRKRLRVFESPQESIRLKSSFRLAESSRGTRVTQRRLYDYDVSLSFDTSLDDLEEYEYEVSFYLQSIEHGDPSSSEIELLLERESVRTNDSMEFSGSFVARHPFLAKNETRKAPPTVDYKLYLEIKRYCWQLARSVEGDAKNQRLEQEAENAVDELGKKGEECTKLSQDESKEEESQLSDVELRSSFPKIELKSPLGNNEVTAKENMDALAEATGNEGRDYGVLDLQTRLQDGLEKQIETLRRTTEKQRLLRDMLEKKVETLESAMDREIYQYEAKLDRREAAYDMCRSIHESRIAKLNDEVDQLRETEHNLLAQLQDTEQRAQSQMQESRGKIAQLELSAESQRMQLEARIEELMESFRCCVCCVNRVNVVWMPCGHARFCDRCVRDNGRKGNQPNDCMICRQPGKAHKFIL